MTPPRTIAMLPTWNEAQTIGPLIDELLALGPHLEVLVVDDNSPDGTWRIVLERAAREPRVHLLHRTLHRGRGLAGIAGFREALRLGAEAVVEMDADGSHQPKWIPSLLERLAEADVVVASRLVPGGGEQGRPWTRRLLTQLANLYIRLLLRLPVRDATSGFRVFSRRCLEALPWDAMQASGPEVVQEVLLAAHARGFRIVEVPYLFVERRAGQSSFNRRLLWRSLLAMLRLRWRPGRLVGESAAVDAEREGAPPLPLPLPAALPLAYAYGVGRAVHRAAAVIGLRPVRRLPAKVVCVGNLTVGGTGKTPMVQLLACWLREQGARPAILSRGYGAPERIRRPLIVSDGVRTLAGPDQAGDEPLLLARECPGVPVVACPDRWRAGREAIERLGADVLLLDDGFQHDRLHRDLDLVLWDVQDDPARMRLLPAGRLREGLGALRRADAIVLTHAEYLDPAQRSSRRTRVIQRLKRVAPHVPILDVRSTVNGWERVSGRMRSDAAEGSGGGALPWSGRRVLAISGIARPRGFERLLAETGARIVHHLAYPDHYVYDTWVFDDWRKLMERLDAELIVTTAKDAVKLAPLPIFGLPIVAMRIAMTFGDARRWSLFLRRALDLPFPSEDTVEPTGTE